MLIVNHGSLLFRENSSSGSLIQPGSTVFVNDVHNVYVQWTYPNNADGGVISGYRVKVYDESGNVVKEYNVKTTDRNGNILIPIEDLKRGQMNDITIEAYYTKPDNSGNLYGPELKSQFIYPMSKLNKPIIDYPVNNTQWHNTNFRVLFKMPEDYDFNTYEQSVQNTYRYANVELKINDTMILAMFNTKDISTGAMIVPQIFSTLEANYKDGMCINPSLLSQFIEANEYTLQVRVMKNYYKQIWSDWSDVVRLTQSPISFSVNIGDKILEKHFNTMRNWSIRLYNVYPINKLPNTNKNVNVNDLILQNNYPRYL